MSRTAHSEISHLQRISAIQARHPKIAFITMTYNHPVPNCHFCKSPMILTEYPNGMTYAYCSASKNEFRCMGLRYVKYNDRCNIQEITISYNDILNFRANIDHKFKQTTSLLYSIGGEIKSIIDIAPIDLNIIQDRNKTLELVAELLKLAVLQN